MTGHIKAVEKKVSSETSVRIHGADCVATISFLGEPGYVVVLKIRVGSDVMV